MDTPIFTADTCHDTITSINGFSLAITIASHVFHVCVHLLTYLWLDHFFDWDEIVTDIIKRPYITFGMLAFTLLLPLALTSTKKMMKRLGKRWKSLHKLVYVIAILGVLHFILLVKADLREPVIYAFILLALFLVRFRKG